MKKTWTKWAFKCGKSEHKFGRWIALPIVLNISYSYYKGYKVNLVLSTITFVCWIIYLSSHTLEKYCFKKAGGSPRTGWNKKGVKWPKIKI